jgi:hypothetical protein
VVTALGPAPALQEQPNSPLRDVPASAYDRGVPRKAAGTERQVATLSWRPTSARYDEPIACVIRILSEQFGVATLPFARFAVLPQSLQPVRHCRYWCRSAYSTARWRH